jgi:hypothetical protein
MFEGLLSLLGDWGIRTNTHDAIMKAEQEQQTPSKPTSLAARNRSNRISPMPTFRSQPKKPPISTALMTSIKFPNMRIDNTTDANPSSKTPKHVLLLLLLIVQRPPEKYD